VVNSETIFGGEEVELGIQSGGSAA